MSAQDQQILQQVIVQAEGNDELLSGLAFAIQSGNPKELQEVVAKYMGVYLSDEKAREVVAQSGDMPEVVAYGT